MTNIGGEAVPIEQEQPNQIRPYYLPIMLPLCGSMAMH